MPDVTTAPILSAADLPLANLYGEKTGTPKTLVRVQMTSILALITGAATGLLSYATVALMEADTSQATGALAKVYANNDDPGDAENGFYQWDGADWVDADWVANYFLPAVQPAIDAADAILTDPGFIAVSEDLEEGEASKIKITADNIANVTTCADNMADIQAAVANLDDIVTMAAGLTGAELAAIRKSKQQVERDRLANLTASIKRFVSSADGDDAQPGRSMARAKASVAGMVASFDWGIIGVTVSGTTSGGNPGTYRLGVSGGTVLTRHAYVELRVNAAGQVSQGIIGWTKAIDPGDYDPAGATPTLTIPAAAGLPSAVATATMGRASPRDTVFGFECGNIFTEQFVVRGAGTTICSYPKGNSRRLPNRDCATPAPTWTNSSGNIWTATLARAADHISVGGEDNYSLFLRNDLDHPGDDDDWLTRKSSAIVEGDAPLTYYIPVATLYAEFNPTTPVTLRAPDGVDPNTLDLFYNYRATAIIGWQEYSGLVLDGIDAGCPLSAQGVINPGDNLLLRRFRFYNGGKHDMVFRSGVVDGGCSWNTELVSNRALAHVGAGLDCIQLTAYRDDPTGLTVDLRNYWAIQPAGVNNAGFFFSHASGPYAYDEVFLEGVGANNGGIVKGVYAKRQIFRGMFFKDVRGTAVAPGAMTSFMAANPSEVLRFEQTHCLVTADASLGSVSSAVAFHTGINSAETFTDDRSDILIAHCGYHNEHDQVLGQSFLTLVNSAKQKIEVRNCTAYMKGRSTMVSAGNKAVSAGSGSNGRMILVRNLANIGQFVNWTNFGTAFDGEWDDNVYIDLAGNANLRWRWNSTAYTWANWVALGTWDQNSVTLNAAQAEDLFLNGVAGYLARDYRLNPECTLTLADGTTPIISLGGIQEYYDNNTGLYLPGQPSQEPVIPTNGPECAEFAFAPWEWDYLAA